MSSTINIIAASVALSATPSFGSPVSSGPDCPQLWRMCCEPSTTIYDPTPCFEIERICADDVPHRPLVQEYVCKQRTRCCNLWGDNTPHFTAR